MRDIFEYECDFPITIESPLVKGADVGLHLDTRSYSNVVVSEGAIEDYITSGKLTADFKGDKLVYDNGKVLIDLAEFTVTFRSGIDSNISAFDSFI